MAQKILLVDGHGLAYRAFYALPGLNAPDGTPTNAILGFFNMFIKIRKELVPDEAYVAFDTKAPTFRHEMMEEYKATRKPTPDELKIQIPILERMLNLAGVKTLSKDGIEADDILACLAVEMAKKGDKVTILTSDKDILQILGENITIIRPKIGITSFTEMDASSFQEEFGFPPSGMVDYLSMLGDSSDNIPGIPGVGEKTAKKLMADYGSLEKIMASSDEQSPSLKKKLQENSQMAFENRKLIALKCDADLVGLTDVNAALDQEEFIKEAKRLGFRKLATQLNEINPAGTNRSSQQQEPKKTASNHFMAASLDQLVKSPRLGVDFEIKKDGSLPDSIIVADDNEKFWTGTFDKFNEAIKIKNAPQLVLSDAKMYCSMMENPIEKDVRNVWDLKTAHYLLHPDQSDHSIKFLSGMDVSPERVGFLLESKDQMTPDIEKYGLDKLMEQMELPLIPVIIGMERHGIRLDKAALRPVSDELEDKILQINLKIEDIAGGPINVSSPKQVGELLFEKLKLPAIKKTKTGYSTDSSVLETLAQSYGDVSPVPEMLLEHRELSKMATGFVAPLFAAADKNSVIHSTFETTVTGTGRLSSRNPNLQNIPVGSVWSNKIRSCLVPVKEGNCFVSGDYSQIEFRVLAHISGDERLMEIFQKDRDIHTETAALIFGIPSDRVTKEQRRYAKMVSFGLLYGMSAFGLASRLGVDRGKASEIMNSYFNALPGVADYMEKAVSEGMANHMSKTEFGRIRPLDEVSAGADRGHLRRVAINTPIQGTAADITKMAMLKVAKHFQGSDVALVLQVHDSLVCECPADKIKEVEKAMEDLMENAVSLKVPLKVDVKSGNSLAEI